MHKEALTNFPGGQQLLDAHRPVREPPHRPVHGQPPPPLPTAAAPLCAGPRLRQVHSAGLLRVQGVQRALPAGTGAGGEGPREQDER